MSEEKKLPVPFFDGYRLRHLDDSQLAAVQAMARDAETPRLKLLGKGTTGFDVAGVRKAEEFEAIILHFTPANVYLVPKEGAESEQDVLPVCWSSNATIPDPGVTERQHDTCAGCLKNMFGSSEKGGKGKACKNMFRVFLLIKGDLVPVLLSIPPSSMRNFRQLLGQLMLKYGFTPYQQVVVKFSTYPEKTSVSGIKNTVIKFDIVGLAGLDEERQQYLDQLTDVIVPALRQKVEGTTLASYVKDDTSDEPTEEVPSGENLDDIPF